MFEMSTDQDNSPASSDASTANVVLSHKLQSTVSSALPPISAETDAEREDLSSAKKQPARSVGSTEQAFSLRPISPVTLPDMPINTPPMNSAFTVSEAKPNTSIVFGPKVGIGPGGC